MHCFANGCKNLAKFRIKIVRWAPATFFCSQECFKKSWKMHKDIHNEPTFADDRYFIYWHLVDMGHLPSIDDLREVKGFSALGKVTGSLADLLLYTVDSILESLSDDDYSAESIIPLFSKLSPHQRVVLLSEVCIGLLDPSAPLPPDTPEHHSAFLYIMEHCLDSTTKEIRRENFIAELHASKTVRRLENKKLIMEDEAEKAKDHEGTEEAEEEATSSPSPSSDMGTGRLSTTIVRTMELVSAGVPVAETSLAATLPDTAAEEQRCEEAVDHDTEEENNKGDDERNEDYFREAPLNNLVERRTRRNVRKTVRCSDKRIKEQSIDDDWRIAAETETDEHEDVISGKSFLTWPYGRMYQILDHIKDARLGEDNTTVTAGGSCGDNNGNDGDDDRNNRDHRGGGDDDNVEDKRKPSSSNAALATASAADDDESSDGDDGCDFSLTKPTYSWRHMYSTYMRDRQPFFALDERDHNEEAWYARHRIAMEDLLPLDDHEHEFLFDQLGYKSAAVTGSHRELMRITLMHSMIDDKVAEFDGKWTRQISLTAERSLRVLIGILGEDNNNEAIVTSATTTTSYSSSSNSSSSAPPSSSSNTSKKDYRDPIKKTYFTAGSKPMIDEAKKLREWTRELFSKFPGGSPPSGEYLYPGDPTPSKYIPHGVHHSIVGKVRNAWVADWHDHMAREGRQYNNITHRLEALYEMHAEAEEAEEQEKEKAKKTAAAAASGVGATSSSTSDVKDAAYGDTSNECIGDLGDGGGAPGSGTRLLLHAPEWAEITSYFDEELMGSTTSRGVASYCGYKSPAHWQIARDLKEKEIECANDGCFCVNIVLDHGGDGAASKRKEEKKEVDEGKELVDEQDDVDPQNDLKDGDDGEEEEQEDNADHRRNGKFSCMRKFKRCAICGVAAYCSPECQKYDWPYHKILCRRWKTEAEEKAKKYKNTNSSSKSQSTGREN